MSERNQSFDALFLRSRDSPSGDRIVSVLTADNGIFDAFVFGGARSSLRSSATPFVFGKIFIYSDSVKNYKKLTDLSIVESFSGLRDSYSKLWSANVIAEFILRTSGCGGEYAEVLGLALEALRLLEKEDEEAAQTIILAFLWKILSIMGVQPDLEKCAHCGRALFPEGGGGSAHFSPSFDGFMCGSCAAGGSPSEQAISLGSGEMSILRSFRDEDLSSCTRIQGSAETFAPLKKIIYFLAQKSAEGTLLTLMAQ